jgi:cobalamin biosynthesis protein CobD/CbiB
MINKIQYIILMLTVTTLISLGISNVSVPAAMAVDSQTSQETQTHLTEVQKALDNNDIEGAKTHLSVAMGLLQNNG